MSKIFIGIAITIFQSIFCTKNEIFIFEEKKLEMMTVISIKQISKNKPALELLCGHLTNDFKSIFHIRPMIISRHFNFLLLSMQRMKNGQCEKKIESGDAYWFHSRRKCNIKIAPCFGILVKYVIF